MFPQKRRIIALACAGIAGLSIQIQPAHAQTASWLSGVSGNFLDGSKWSSNPDYPNGAGSIAVIGAAGSGYTVSLDSSVGSVSLAQLSLNADAELDLSGTLATPSITISNGSLLLDNGTISGATVTTSGGGQLVLNGSNSTGGSLDTVTLNTDLVNQSSELDIYNGLTLNNHTLALSSNTSNAFIDALGAQTIGGTGTVQFDGNLDRGFISCSGIAPIAGTLTIGPGITVQTGTASGDVGGAALVNNGTLLGQTAGKTLEVVAGTFTNNGIIRTANGGVVDILATIPVGGLGNFDATGGVVSLSGTLLNSGSTLNLSGPAQVLTFNNGIISGGTITTSAGGQLNLINNNGGANLIGGTLDGVTLDTDLTNQSTRLSIYNGLTLHNHTLTLSSITNADIVDANGAQTIGGTGTIQFDGNFDNGFILCGGDSSGTGTLTIGSGIIVQTGSAGGIVGGEAMVNNGTLLSHTAGKTLQIQAGTFTNAGLIRATNGGIVDIAATISVGGLGNIDASGGTVSFSGTLLNSGNTLNLSSRAEALTFNNGTISGGTITTSGGGQLVLNNSTTGNDTGGTLDGVTLDTDLTVPSATLVLYNGLTLHNRTLSLDSESAGSVVQPLGDQTIGGTGTVEFDGSNPNATIAGFSDGTTLGKITVGSGITIQTGTVGGAISGNGIINNGTLLAQNSQTLQVAASLTNNGMIRATSGGTVDLDGTIPVGGLGNFNATGGVVSLSGTLLNTGNTLNLAGPGEVLTFNNGVISGGTVTTSSGGQLVVNNGGNLDGVTLDTDLTIHSTLISLYDGLTLNNRTVSLDSQAIGAVTIYVIGSQTIGGTGTVEFDGSNPNATIAGFSDGTTVGTITVGSGITIQTGTVGGTIGGNGLINNGTLLAQNSQTLQVAAPITNNGTLSATTNGHLLVTGTFDVSGSGTITTATGGVVEINGAVQAPANVTSSLNVSAGTTLLSGTLNVGTNAELEKIGDGTLILAGLQNWAPGSTLEMAGGVADIQSDPGGNVTLHVNATTLHFQGGISNPILKAAGLTFNTPGTGIIDPGGLTTVETQTLHIDVNDGGKMDINDDKLVVDYDPPSGNADPIDTIRGYIQHAYDGGAWDGTGLGSSMAEAVAADPTQHAKTGVYYLEASQLPSSAGNTFGAATVDNTAILIGYGLMGDANMDGTVNALDFNILATNYGNPGDTIQGDFDYSGTIGSGDFDVLAANYGAVMATSSTIPASSLGTLNFGELSRAVPEPMGMGVLLMGSLALSRKRRIN